MKKVTQKRNKKSKSLKEQVYAYRYVAWMVLLPVISFIYQTNSFETFQDIRFLILTVSIIVYTGLLLWAKPGGAIAIRNPLTKWFFLAGLCFLLWSIISTFFSVSHYEGLPVIAQTFMLGLSVFFIMESLSAKQAVEKCMKIFTVVFLVHAIVGLLQVSGIGFTDLPGSFEQPVGFSGNRNLLGGLLSGALFIPLYLAIFSEKTWRHIGVFTCFTMLAAIIWSQTRTAWLTTMGLSVLLAIGWLLINGPQNSKKMLKPAAIFIALVALLVVGSIAISSKKDNALSNRITSLVKAKNKSHENYKGNIDGSIQERLKTWSQTLSMIKEHPITGVGPGNWKLMIDLYGSGGSSFDSGDKVRIKPHNIYLRVLSETGVPGLLLYLSMFMVLAVGQIRLLKSDLDIDLKKKAWVLGLGVAAFLMDSFPNFSISRTEHALLFAFAIGAVLSVFEKNTTGEKAFQLGKTGFLALVALPLFFCLAVAYSKFEFEKYFKAIKTASRSGNHDVVLKLAENKSFLLTKLNFLTAPAEMYTAIAYREKKDYTRAIEEVEKALSYHPNNPDVLNTYATIYMVQGKLPESLTYLNKALAITPNYHAVKRNLIMTYYSMGDCEKVLQVKVRRRKIQEDEGLKKVLDQCKRRLNQ